MKKNNKLKNLILDLRLKQYQINNTNSIEYLAKYKKERIELEREIFKLIDLNVKSMSSYEQKVFMLKVKPMIINSVANIGSWEEKEFTNRLYEVYGETYFNTDAIIKSGLSKSTINFTLVSPEMIKRAVFNDIKGENFSSRIWKNKAKLANDVYNSIEEIIVDGTDIRKIASQLSKKYDVAFKNAMRLIQNETTRVMTEAQDEIYKNSDVVEDEMFVATLDDRTTETCRGLDGSVYDKNDYYKPRIPEDTHVGCRSCYVPIVNGWSATNRYDNLNKKQIEYMTYEQYSSFYNI